MGKTTALQASPRVARSGAARRDGTAEERRREAATGCVHGTHQGLGGAQEEETVEGGDPEGMQK